MKKFLIKVEKAEEEIRKLNDDIEELIEQAKAPQLQRGHGTESMEEVMNAMKLQVEKLEQHEHQHNKWKGSGTAEINSIVVDTLKVIGGSLKKANKFIDRQTKALRKQTQRGVATPTEPQGSSAPEQVHETAGASPSAPAAPSTEPQDPHVQEELDQTAHEDSIGASAPIAPLVSNAPGILNDAGVRLISPIGCAIPTLTFVSGLYTLDVLDEGHANIGHGTMKDCENAHGDEVSFLFFPSCSLASEMRETLDYLSDLARNVVNTRFVENMDDNCENSRRLVIDRVTSTTFDAWFMYKEKEVQKTFFRELFSTLGAIHRGGKCFGNVRDGIRIKDGKPVFVFAAYSSGIDIHKGQWNDLKEAERMVRDAFPDCPEKDGFISLCDKFLHAFERSKIRVASFFITHTPLVYKDRDIYNFIRKLSEFKTCCGKSYDVIVEDNDGVPLIPGWQDEIKSLEEDDLPRVTYNYWVEKEKEKKKKKEEEKEKEKEKEKAKLKIEADTDAEEVKEPPPEPKEIVFPSENIRRLHRDSYEHAKKMTYLDVSKIFYKTFPTACSDLYEKVLIERLYPFYGNYLIKFFQSDPSSLNF